MDDKPKQSPLPLFSLEEWRDVPGYEGRYMVSNHGRVKSLIGREKLLKPGTTTNGHQIVGLSKDNESKSIYVHSLVALAFIGEKPDGLLVNHKDGNPRNNDPSNLEYVTFSKNVEHGYRLHGRKINARKAALIVELINTTNKSLTEIAELMGVVRMDIYWIMRGHIWREYAAQITDEARRLKRPNYMKKKR